MGHAKGNKEWIERDIYKLRAVTNWFKEKKRPAQSLANIITGPTLSSQGIWPVAIEKRPYHRMAIIKKERTSHPIIKGELQWRKGYSSSSIEGYSPESKETKEPSGETLRMESQAAQKGPKYMQPVIFIIVPTANKKSQELWL